MKIPLKELEEELYELTHMRAIDLSESQLKRMVNLDNSIRDRKKRKLVKKDAIGGIEEK